MGERVQHAKSVYDIDSQTRRGAHAVILRAIDAAAPIAIRAERKDYGRLTKERLGRFPTQPGTPAPAMLALVSVLESEGHDMTAVRAEVQRMCQSLAVAYGW
jgi:hypothetical protein